MDSVQLRFSWPMVDSRCRRQHVPITAYSARSVTVFRPRMVHVVSRARSISHISSSNYPRRLHLHCTLLPFQSFISFTFRYADPRCLRVTTAYPPRDPALWTRPRQLQGHLQRRPVTSAPRPRHDLREQDRAGVILRLYRARNNSRHNPSRIPLRSPVLAYPPPSRPLDNLRHDEAPVRRHMNLLHHNVSQWDQERVRTRGS
ncbi:hypothetical protein EXIGLDRAFT_413320 [Exidia glandulosa HHB12029]|uniref:Uncharacterized protein n=1 Tax=Exidia glandulosa HHB12029 TaxID=1314781 RepID=A0A165Z922_EXIGL|nr:hypothetical protein EXIGLDRAFT_413320 [Exidia glandulosa HHB12029]